MNRIYDAALQCRTYIDQNINIVKNKIIKHLNNSNDLVFYDYDISGDYSSLLDDVKRLYELINEKYPDTSRLISDHIKEFENDKIIHLSAIQAFIAFIIEAESKPKNSKSIFISHSSKDKNYVRLFVDYILQLGIGIQSSEIFCTSIEDLAVKNGEDIRQHIHNNIKYADFSFLLISSNYKQSEICMNEMGAVWAYDAKVKLFLLPDSSFDEIGWLCEPYMANKVNDVVALDALFHEMTDYYSLPKHFESWSRYRASFCDIFESKQ